MDYICTVTQSNDYFEFAGFVVDFYATAQYVHEDMVKYYPDGSGHPGCDDIEDKDWTINSVTDEDGNELKLGEDNYPVGWTEEQKKQLEAAISDYLDNHDWDYPEPDYPEWDEED